MSGDRMLLSPARLKSMPAYVAFLMLAIGAISFFDNRLFSTVTGVFGVMLPVSSLFLEIIALPAMLALASLRAWKERTLKTVMFLSLLLYLPSVLGVSGIDLLKASGFTYNLSAFAVGLPAAAIAIFGILLACGVLLLRSFALSKSARNNLIGRGAAEAEVDLALYRNALLETRTIAGAGAVAVVFALGVPLIEPVLLLVLQSARFVYVLAGLGAALVLALVLLSRINNPRR